MIGRDIIEKAFQLESNQIESIIKECKRVKIQRNTYEQKLLKANRELVNLHSELELLNHYKHNFKRFK